jgi:hypothetical protein
MGMTETFFVARVGDTGGTADVIFIHGLTGHAKTTWSYPDSDEPSGPLWPKWIKEYIPGLNVYMLNYPSSLFRQWSKKEMSLFERAKATLDYLASYDGIGNRPIAIVTHSLGGLLAKQIIRTGLDSSDRAWKAIAENCRLVIFLATPHTGAGLASIFNFFFPRLRSGYMSLLQAYGSELDQLNDAYRKIAPRRKIKTTAFYETWKTKKALIIVGKGEADPGVAETELIAVGADHITICKPSNRHHEVYRGVLRRLQEFASNAAVISAKADKDQAAATVPQLFASMYGDGIATVLYFVLPFDGETIFAIPIQFIVKASGLRTIKNAHLKVEVADRLYLHNLIHREMNKIGTARKIKVVSDKGRTEHIAQVLYQLPAIHPNVRVSIWDHIFVKDSSVVEMKVDDSRNPVIVKGFINYPITLMVDGKDALPWAGEVKLQFRKGNFDDFSGVKQEEDRLIREIMQSGSANLDPCDATFIGFKKFTPRLIENSDLKMLDCDANSMTGINVSVTPTGVEPRK